MRPTWRTIAPAPPAARSIRYRDRYEIIYAPATGGGTLAEAFNILEGYDFSGMDPRSAAALQPFIEACRVAYADRWQYLADEEYADVPWQVLESKDYAQARRRQIPAGRAVETVNAWDRQAGESGNRRTPGRAHDPPLGR